MMFSLCGRYMYRYIYYFSVKFFHQLLFFSYNISLGVAVDEFFVVFMLGKYADSISKLYVALSVFSQEIADDQKMWLLLWGTSQRSKNKRKCFIHLWKWVGIFSKHKNSKITIYLFKDNFFLSANHFLYIWSAWVVPIPPLLTYLWKFLHLS